MLFIGIMFLKILVLFFRFPLLSFHFLVWTSRMRSFSPTIYQKLCRWINHWITSHSTVHTSSDMFIKISKICKICFPPKPMLLGIPYNVWLNLRLFQNSPTLDLINYANIIIIITSVIITVYHDFEQSISKHSVHTNMNHSWKNKHHRESLHNQSYAKMLASSNTKPALIWFTLRNWKGKFVLIGRTELTTEFMLYSQEIH